MEKNRIPRKNALPLGDALKQFLKESHLSTGLNTQRVFAAWDQASGAGKYTLRRYFRSGVLYITVDSSVVRSQLQFQKDALVDKMNDILRQDELFIPDDPFAAFVTDLKLK